MKEYTLDTRQITSLVLVVLALLVVVFFLGVTVGEHHERARVKKGGKIRVILGGGASRNKGPGVAREGGGSGKVSREVSPSPSGKGAPSRTASRISGAKAGASGVSRGVLRKGYYVQVGAFREKVWAEKWQSQARSRGYHALVVYSRARNLYRVVIGPYPSREEGVKVARKVDKIFKVRSSVVPDSRLR